MILDRQMGPIFRKATAARKHVGPDDHAAADDRIPGEEIGGADQRPGMIDDGAGGLSVAEARGIGGDGPDPRGACHLQLPGELRRQPAVVAVEKRDPFAARPADSPVAWGRRTARPRTVDPHQPRVRDRLDVRAALVSRAVVADEDFEIRLGLPEDVADGRDDRRSPVPGRDDHTDVHAHDPWPLASDPCPLSAEKVLPGTPAARPPRCRQWDGRKRLSAPQDTQARSRGALPRRQIGKAPATLGDRGGIFWGVPRGGHAGPCPHPPGTSP